MRGELFSKSSSEFFTLILLQAHKNILKNDIFKDLPYTLYVYNSPLHTILSLEQNKNDH